MKGKYVQRDITKAVYYFTLSANQKNKEAQYNLGLMYESGKNIKRDINKAIYYFSLSSSEHSHFHLGVIYHEGKHINRDIKKAIYHYKNASSFNNQYAKNNLGVIFKNGDMKNISFSIIYFTEAIRQKNDELAMYNLARLLFFEIDDWKNAIVFLLNSLNRFPPSFDFLCLVLLKKIDSISSEKIKDLLMNYQNFYDGLAIDLYNNIKDKNMEHHLIFDYLFNLYSELDFYYDSFLQYRSFFEKEIRYDAMEHKNLKNIDNFFYEGFGIDF